MMRRKRYYLQQVRHFYQISSFPAPWHNVTRFSRLGVLGYCLDTGTIPFRCSRAMFLVRTYS